MSAIPLPPGTRVDFELVLRYRASQHALVENERNRLLAGEAARPSADPADRSADPADIEAVRSFATRAGFDILEVDAAARRVRLSGTAALIDRTFHVTLVARSAGARSWRDCDGAPTMPAVLRPIVEAVLGLSEKPAATPARGT